ncbi:putative nitroreductase family protein [Venustampulla echinocandica]|uniref:Putative nitroreductase family protein n=1 Tax=Venustampulla echinocandica TaxID=2656787 RepID=A0A370TPF2_9HELO|nr:putative nitroreductase family protein [Venustampulla echinocandica]RDL37403.1 putative nitroreductase family protein [Venustampulla echinocandica]
MASQPFLEAIESRRTFYQLSKSSPVSDTRIQEIIKHAVLHVPSSFNSQSTRVILLVKEEHDKLWEITKTVLKGIVSEEQWTATEQKLNMFKAAYGTVLFFESRSTVAGMQAKFPLYADKFPVWASQSDGMHQFTIWTALEAEGLGANLQHYNPLIDEKVASEWNVDPDWSLNAQLVFGKPEGGAGNKTFMKVEEERFRVFGA